jgi:hypothetical protein
MRRCCRCGDGRRSKGEGAARWSVRPDAETGDHHERSGAADGNGIRKCHDGDPQAAPGKGRSMGPGSRALPCLRVRQEDAGMRRVRRNPQHHADVRQVRRQRQKAGSRDVQRLQRHRHGCRKVSALPGHRQCRAEALTVMPVSRDKAGVSSGAKDDGAAEGCAASTDGTGSMVAMLEDERRTLLRRGPAGEGLSFC